TSNMDDVRLLKCNPVVLGGLATVTSSGPTAPVLVLIVSVPPIGILTEPETSNVVAFAVPTVIASTQVATRQHERNILASLAKRERHHDRLQRVLPPQPGRMSVGV